MKTPRASARRLVALAALALAPPNATDAQESADSGLEARVDAYLAPFVTRGDFSGAVLLGTRDSILLAKGYGMADVEHGAPNRPETRFPVASITKTFTAAATLLLRDDGALSLDDPVSRHVPEFPHGARIRIIDLLRHRSGLANPNYLESFGTEPIELSELVRRIGEKPLLFAPGSEGRYSNAGYNVLAYIVERRSGLPYAGFLAERILRPLGMTDTGQPSSLEIVPRLARGYLPGPPPYGIVPAPVTDASYSTGSGSLYSTVLDLYEWARAVDMNRLFDRTSLAYPFGWGRLGASGEDGISQTGLTPGYASSLSIRFDPPLYVIVLANVQYADWGEWNDDLAAIALGARLEPPEPASTVALPATGLDRYTGRYGPAESGSGLGRLAVRHVAGGLWVRWDGWPVPFYLSPLSETEFDLRGDCGRMRFDGLAEREYRELIWICGDTRTVLHRLPTR